MDRQRKWEGILGGWGNITEDPGMNTVSYGALKGLGCLEFSRCSENHGREDSTSIWTLERSSLQDPTVLRRGSAVKVF